MERKKKKEVYLALSFGGSGAWRLRQLSTGKASLAVAQPWREPCRRGNYPQEGREKCWVLSGCSGALWRACSPGSRVPWPVSQVSHPDTVTLRTKPPIHGHYWTLNKATTERKTKQNKLILWDRVAFHHEVCYILLQDLVSRFFLLRQNQIEHPLWGQISTFKLNKERTLRQSTCMVYSNVRDFHHFS